MNACVHLYSLITATSPGTTEVPDGTMYTVVFDCGTPLLQQLIYYMMVSIIIILVSYCYCIITIVIGAISIYYNGYIVILQ